MDKDESALADLERAKELAGRIKSFIDAGAVLAQGLDNQTPERVLYWAILYYSLVSDDKEAYQLVETDEPQLTKEFHALVA
jgi:hypothetical protein